MKEIIKRPIKKVMTHILAGLFAFTDFFKSKIGIMLKTEQLRVIANCLPKKGCNFLVFGLGNDSFFWKKINKHGTTFFLENNKNWLKKYAKTNSFLINYNTKASEWKNYLGKEEKLKISLPKKISDIKWDVILVDAPVGAKAGRMKSIYMASKLIKKGGHVFVHDYDREIEKAFSDKYLMGKNLKEKIGNLNHYIMNSE